jgi:hypothetical protein
MESYKLDPECIDPMAALAGHSLGQRLQGLYLDRLDLEMDEGSLATVKHQVEIDIALAEFMMKLVLNYFAERGALDELL